MKLQELKIGQEATITAINLESSKSENNKKLKKHFLDMGLTKGTKVKMIGKAPMGDPITIELRGYKLSVGNSDLIEVQKYKK